MRVRGRGVRGRGRVRGRGVRGSERLRGREAVTVCIASYWLCMYHSAGIVYSAGEVERNVSN